MPARRNLDPEGTRETILQAALTLFSERGFGATSIRDVAERAKVTKSLVLYHFESKETLWTTTLEAHVRPMIVVFLRYANGDPSLTFRDLLVTRFKFMRDSPHLPRLMAWLTLEAAPFPGPINEIAPRVLARAKEELAAAPDQKHPPEMVATLALGALDGWFRYRGIYEHIAGIPVDDPASDDAFFATFMDIMPLPEVQP